MPQAKELRGGGELRYIQPNIEDIEINLARWPNTGETEMKTITVAVLALAMTSPFAFAHKHKGWGCHTHSKDEQGLSWGRGNDTFGFFKRTHCGNGSR